jgi:DNA-binding NarL/FixJ family response regulator
MTSPPVAPTPSALQACAAISPAEHRVLEQLSRGLSNKGIARVLVLSPRTVESHISSLLAKTGCENRTQLLLWRISARSGEG